jgi:hypothetical protein
VVARRTFVFGPTGVVGTVVGTVVTFPVSEGVGVTVGVPAPGSLVVQPAKVAKPTTMRERSKIMQICFFNVIGVRVYFSIGNK